jgi:hypothetical protein
MAAGACGAWGWGWLGVVHVVSEPLTCSGGAGPGGVGQTVLAAALEVVATASAPMLPHLAEDAWLALPWPAPTRSVFQARGPARPA